MSQLQCTYILPYSHNGHVQVTWCAYLKQHLFLLCTCKCVNWSFRWKYSLNIPFHRCLSHVIHSIPNNPITYEHGVKNNYSVVQDLIFYRDTFENLLKLQGLCSHHKIFRLCVLRAIMLHYQFRELINYWYASISGIVVFIFIVVVVVS